MQRVFLWWLLVLNLVEIFFDYYFTFGASAEEESDALAVDPLDSKHTFGCIHHAYSRDVHPRSRRPHRTRISIVRVRDDDARETVRTGDIG